ncbi:hypothetical protein VOLCADRAFT_87913 [Volvox carteri f. nagariensis]|uniref:AP2/ERF domain-containing protein n=1 Tax=Volvox carteri f. nagariensis TaxID=3068 RepID=D8TMK4_VOLCA|nr:uncharacterized protein VOLCADRAFT_87913 [Volvox carteri f. nagariensis]EFJ51139.1 hypothetical protein VOLCADRAFT_87913 [Volvox carteri f. nagariensis]|eukprot:XP_002947606.1 hypothetical protein VOLCADRAFT_87913 [Volvox carteri f. nagariensis]
MEASAEKTSTLGSCDKLDHRRVLRRNLCTGFGQMEALALVAKASSRHSLFKGVTLYKRTSKWRAQISHGGRTVTLGDYNTEEEAARVFDRACICKYGKDAVCNFPLEDYMSEWEELWATTIPALLIKFKEERQRCKAARGPGGVRAGQAALGQQFEQDRIRPEVVAALEGSSTTGRHGRGLDFQSAYFPGTAYAHPGPSGQLCAGNPVGGPLNQIQIQIQNFNDHRRTHAEQLKMEMEPSENIERATSDDGDGDGAHHLEPTPATSSPAAVRRRATASRPAATGTAGGGGGGGSPPDAATEWPIPEAAAAAAAAPPDELVTVFTGADGASRREGLAAATRPPPSMPLLNFPPPMRLHGSNYVPSWRRASVCSGRMGIEGGEFDGESVWKGHSEVFLSGSGTAAGDADATAAQQRRVVHSPVAQPSVPQPPSYPDNFRAQQHGSDGGALDEMPYMVDYTSGRVVLPTRLGFPTLPLLNLPAPRTLTAKRTVREEMAVVAAAEVETDDVGGTGFAAAAPQSPVASTHAVPSGFRALGTPLQELGLDPSHAAVPRGMVVRRVHYSTSPWPPAKRLRLAAIAAAAAPPPPPAPQTDEEPMGVVMTTTDTAAGEGEEEEEEVDRNARFAKSSGSDGAGRAAECRSAVVRRWRCGPPSGESAAAMARFTAAAGERGTAVAAAASRPPMTTTRDGVSREGSCRQRPPEPEPHTSPVPAACAPSSAAVTLQPGATCASPVAAPPAAAATAAAATAAAAAVEGLSMEELHELLLAALSRPPAAAARRGHQHLPSANAPPRLSLQTSHPGGSKETEALKNPSSQATRGSSGGGSIDRTPSHVSPLVVAPAAAAAAAAVNGGDAAAAGGSMFINQAPGQKWRLPASLHDWEHTLHERPRAPAVRLTLCRNDEYDSYSVGGSVGGGSNRGADASLSIEVPLVLRVPANLQQQILSMLK